MSKLSKKQFDELYVGVNKVVVCYTEELTKELLTEADKHGYHWKGGNKYTEPFGNFYRFDLKGFGYSLSKGCRVSITGKDYEIIEFNGFQRELKVDDIVLIRRDLRLHKGYPSVTPSQDMIDLGGKAARILEVHKGFSTTYKLNIDNCVGNWTEEMFFDDSPEITNKDHISVEDKDLEKVREKMEGLPLVKMHESTCELVGIDRTKELINKTID